MSDVSQGSGWWLASDGKWYPPESAPAAPPPPPPPPTETSPTKTANAEHTPASDVPDEDEPTQKPGRRWGRRTIGVIVAFVLLLAALGVTALLLAGGSSSISAHGTMELDDFTGDCVSDAGFSDITDGAQVTVTNSSGTVIGNGTLSYDTNQSSAQSNIQPGMSVCIYRFAVTVPGGLSRYGITISHRGTIWFTSAQMTKGPGLSLSSGGTGQ